MCEEAKIDNYVAVDLKVTASKVFLLASRHLAPAVRLACAPAEQALPYRATPHILQWVSIYVHDFTKHA